MGPPRHSKCQEASIATGSPRNGVKVRVVCRLCFSMARLSGVIQLEGNSRVSELALFLQWLLPARMRIPLLTGISARTPTVLTGRCLASGAAPDRRVEAGDPRQDQSEPVLSGTWMREYGKGVAESRLARCSVAIQLDLAPVPSGTPEQVAPEWHDIRPRRLNGRYSRRPFLHTCPFRESGWPCH